MKEKNNEGEVQVKLGLKWLRYVQATPAHIHQRAYICLCNDTNVVEKSASLFA